MANDVELNTFPKNRAEALTMLYLNNQDLSNKSPTDIVKLYSSAIQEVREALRTTNNSSVKFF